MPDKETQTIVTEGQQLEDFTKSAGWGLVKTRFTNKILDLQSVMNIEGTSPDQIAMEMYARRLAVTYLTDLLKEIEGLVHQHKNNTEQNPVLVQY